MSNGPQPQKNVALLRDAMEFQKKVTSFVMRSKKVYMQTYKVI
jgi:hypothetical protein